MGPAGLYKLPKRTFLDADGKPTTDETKANELLGIAGDEIPMARALELGIADDGDAAAAAPSGHVLAERTYLDAEGKATTDESEANSLLGNAGATIPTDVAVTLGLAEEGADDAGSGAPSKDDVMADHARELRKMKADDVRKLAASLEISTEGNADVVRGRLMEHHAKVYDAEHAEGGQGSEDNGADPDVDDSGAQ